MTALGIIGLILGIIVMIVFAYWGLNAVPLSLLAGAVICIFNGINLWTGFATSWAGVMRIIFRVSALARSSRYQFTAVVFP